MFHILVRWWNLNMSTDFDDWFTTSKRSKYWITGFSQATYLLNTQHKILRQIRKNITFFETCLCFSRNTDISSLCWRSIAAWFHQRWCITELKLWHNAICIHPSAPRSQHFKTRRLGDGGEETGSVYDFISLAERLWCVIFCHRKFLTMIYYACVDHVLQVI